MSRRLDLAVQYAANAAWLPDRRIIRAWVRAALDADGAANPRGGTITVRFVDPDEGRRLNREFRKKDYATNVLSFPYATCPRVAGDLVLAPAVCAAEAREAGKPRAAHLAHLVVHGILHLMGYDHASAAAARRMEDREREVLGALGWGDPYAASRPPAVRR